MKTIASVILLLFLFSLSTYSAPTIILNYPPNNTVFASVGNITLNATIKSIAGSNTCVRIFGNNSATPDNLTLLYEQCSVSNNMLVTYNWTAPVLASDSSTVLLMHFDNRSEFGENLTVAHDFSSYQKNASVGGGATYRAGAGKFGGMLNMSGNNGNDKVNVSGSALSMGANWTVEAWIRTKGKSFEMRILGKRNGSGGAEYRLSVLGTGSSPSSGLAQFFIRDNLSKVTQVASNSFNVTNDVYHYIVGVRDNSTGNISIYVDGVLRNTAADNSTSGFNNNNLLVIGGRDDTFNPFLGAIDEVRISNRSLSATEILNNYQLANGTYYWYIVANDSQNATTSTIPLFLVGPDTMASLVSNTSVNSTSVTADQNICVNATAVDPNGASIGTVLAQIVFPNATVTNFTLSDTGCGAGSGGDTWYGASINTGSAAGTLYINTTFANDSFGNMGNQSPFPNLAVTVLSSGTPAFAVDLLSPSVSTTLCASDFASCQLNMTCQYNCTGAGTCNSILIFAHFRNTTASEFKNISGSAFDSLRLNGSETNPHSVGNLSAGENANSSFIVRSNLASANDTIRCAGSSTNAGQFIGFINVNVSASVFVDTSLNASSIPFDAVDPATQNNPSTSNAIGFTNTENSNVVVDIYLNSTNMTSGSNSIPYFNLSVATGNTPAVSMPLNESRYINGTTANAGYIENLAINSSISMFFFLDVPAGQTAGVYNGTVVIRSVQNGVAP